ncbi:hypothetical protein Vi05172_g10134 [Venturia inaequalis]|nr:hypothetical protein Vi05172_g10134 [Venturia inaequalis]
MAASRTVVNWDDVTEKRLLEAILANSVVSATDWAAVAVHIGEQVTGHACKLVPPTSSIPHSPKQTNKKHTLHHNQTSLPPIQIAAMPTGQPNGVRFSWDEKYEFRLLLEIITVQCNASGLAIDWGAVAGGVKDGLTPKACMLVFPATPPPFSRLPPFTLLNTQQPTLLSPSTMPRPANGSQFKWDDATEKRLLLAVLSNCIVPPNLDWAAIASGVDSQVTASSARLAFPFTSFLSHSNTNHHYHLHLRHPQKWYTTGTTPLRSDWHSPCSRNSTRPALTGSPSPLRWAEA